MADRENPGAPSAEITARAVSSGAFGDFRRGFAFECDGPDSFIVCEFECGQLCRLWARDAPSLFPFLVLIRDFLSNRPRAQAPARISSDHPSLS